MVQKSKLGDSKAFGELVKMYQKRVYYMVFRYLKSHEKTEEAIQKTFIDAWKYINNFEGRSSFLTWLLRIAINNSKKDLLQSKVIAEVNIDDVEIPDYPKVLEQLSELERNTLLASEIRKLSAKQQTILHLRIYEDLSFKQIGEVLGCSENTAKSHFHHIKKLLKKSINEEDGEAKSKDKENGNG
jgi:RNA polymerase sigma-70 factor (ECF subfamily)